MRPARSCDFVRSVHREPLCDLRTIGDGRGSKLVLMQSSTPPIQVRQMAQTSVSAPHRKLHAPGYDPLRHAVSSLSLARRSRYEIHCPEFPAKGER